MESPLPSLNQLLASRLCAVFVVFGVLMSHGSAQTEPPTSTRDRATIVPAALRFSAPPNEESIAEASLTSPEAVAAAIDSLQKDTAMDATLRERLLPPLNQALEQFKQRAADADRLAGIAKALAAAPEATRGAKSSVETQIPASEPTNDVAIMSIEKVRELRSEAEVNSNAARQNVQTLEATVRERQTRKELLPKLIQEARKTADELETSSIAQVEDDPAGRLKAVRETERAARLAALRQRVEMLVQEQALYEAETDLLPLKLTLAKRELTRAESTLQWWSSALRERRESQIEEELAAHRMTLQRDGIPPEQSMVLSLADRWMQTVNSIETIERKLVRNQSRCDELDQILQANREEIKRDLAVGGSLRAGLGLKLQLQRNKLPKLANLHAEVDRADVAIEESRSLLTRLEITLEETVGGPINGISFGDTESLPTKNGEVHPEEVQRLKRFAADLGQEITKLVELRGLYELKLNIVEELRLEIDSHVMWIRNTTRYSLADAKTAWVAIRWIMHPDNLKLLSTKMIEGCITRMDRTALILAMVVFICFFASRLRKRLYNHGKQASARNASTLIPTWRALVVTILLSLPLAIALWAVGQVLMVVAEREAIVIAFSDALIFASAALVPLELLRQVLRSGGLATAHFGVSETTIVPLRQGLRVLIDLGLPLVVLWSVCQSLGRALVDASLGRLLFSLGMGLIAMLLWQSFHPKRGLLASHLRSNQDGWLSRLRHVWFTGIVAIPISLAGVSLFGYSYAASQLIERLYWTLWLALITFLIGGMLKRWLLVQRRRLAWAVRREKMEQSERLEGSVLEISPDDSLEAAEINAQTSRLIHTALTLAAMIGLVWVWSPVFPAIRFLESFELWPTTLADGTIEQVTLANLVLALPIIVLTWVAVRNLPGLIEGVLLERLPLEKAVRYAITTLASYALMAVGVLFSAKTLGLRWESIQWLVAALGVGLGFGLQEIFANFVSGVILLFEQPIRIGDVVTLGDTTGMVSRIRIRATTVTNWDRQELIIPNKDLITGRLINWTLSDSTNRILLNVGVAYGTDTRQACHLLETICHEHPHVCVDPKPVVTFDGFGDSTLNLVVRCFLTTLDVRLQTIHELHTEINERFKESRIEISFPQRDLHLRSLPAEMFAMLGAERMAA